MDHGLRRIASYYCSWAILLGLLLPPVYSQSGTPGFTPTDQDFEFPLQDLDEIKGEIIWLQGGLKRGDPSPYQNPLVPLATYEQGLLDRDGKLWTFLDTPKGRELRYNKQLRGKVVVVKGWLYDKSQIIEVYSWKDSQSHPVRLDVEFPNPLRVPFEPEKAETIEPIPPVSPEVPGKDLIGEDMWKKREGLDLLHSEFDSPIPLPTPSQEGDRLRQFIQESQKENSESSGGEIENGSSSNTTNPDSSSGIERIDLRTHENVPQHSPETTVPGSATTQNSRNSERSPLQKGITDPKEMFDASRKALLEQ